MKTIVMTVLIAMCVAQHASSSELSLEYSDGWTPDYTLNIDFATGAIKQALDTGETREAKLINHENVGAYVIGLLTLISTNDPGGIFGDDTPHYRIVVTDGNKKTRLTIGFIYPPGAIYLNKDYPSETELADALLFQKHTPSYLLTYLLHQIVDNYLTKQKVEKTPKEKIANKALDATSQ